MFVERYDNLDVIIVEYRNGKCEIGIRRQVLTG